MHSLTKVSLFLLILSSQLFGLVIEYDGSYGPTSSFPPFNYAIFGNTSMTSDGDLLTMTTFYPGEGVWFGRWGDLGPTSQGTYLGVRARLTEGSGQFSIYFTDSTHFAGAYLNPVIVNDKVSLSLAGGDRLIDLDVNQFNTYEFWLKDGVVVYGINGVLAGEGPAYTSPSNVMVIGDGSATDVSGFGTMQVDWVTIRTGADFSTAPDQPSGVPEPASMGLLAGGLASGAFLRWRRRSAQ